MKRTLRAALGAALALAAVALPGAAHAAPPLNDNFADAMPISLASLPFTDTFTIDDATVELGEPGFCAFSTQTVWYSFTPSSTVIVQADMAGSSTGGTNVNVYEASGPGLAGLSFLGCGSFGGPVQFTASAGTTYYLQGENFFGNNGLLQLNLSVVPPPPFDDISNAKSIPSSTTWSYGFYDQADSATATTTSGDPSCFGGGHTVWYVFTPSEDMQLEAAIDGPPAGIPPHFTLSAFRGSAGSLTQLGCSDDSFTLSGYAKPHVEFSAKAGVPVYFMIGASGSSPGGVFTLHLQRPLVITTKFDSPVGVSKTGTATVSGVTTCSRPVVGNHGLALRQVFGRLVANGYWVTDYSSCSPLGTRWSAQINSSTGVLFGPGPASLSAQWSNQCDLQGCQPGALFGQGYGRIDSATIQLRRSK